VDLALKATDTHKSARPLFYGAACFVLAIASVLLLGSVSQRSRFAGLVLVLASGLMAWLGKRARYRFLRPQSPAESRGHYILIALALAGVLAVLMPPADRMNVVRYVFLLLARASAHQ
jgi:hypothetical protein